MTNEDLIALALQFRAQKLWETLDDSMMFAVRLPDGSTGYCCVMGNAGQHYGLGVYIGDKGITAYINSVNRPGGVDSLEAFQTYDCLNCDFDNAGNTRLSTSQKKQIRAVAAERNIKMCRSLGYPEFIRYDFGLIRTELNQDEIDSLGVALEAGLEVARKLKGAEWHELGFPDEYPSLDKGTRIPMLARREDGSFEWSATVTPELMWRGFPTYELPVGPALRLKAMKHGGVLQCKVMHMPTPLKCDSGMYYPLMMIMAAEEEGMTFPMMQDTDDPHAEIDFLCKLASTLTSSGVCPKTIVVDDAYSEAFLKDFCKKTGIRLKQTDFLPQVEEMAYMLRMHFGG